MLCSWWSLDCSGTFPQGILREFPLVFGHLTFVQPIQILEAFFWLRRPKKLSVFVVQTPVFSSLQHTHEHVKI